MKGFDDMIIREDRDRLIDIIDEYLHEEITAFVFDDRLRTISNSKDETVAQVTHNLWYYYDDCKDHKVVATKELWDYLQRILLLLKSNAEIEIIKQTRWSYTQIFALLLFTVSVYIFIVTKSLHVGILANTVLWPFSYLIYRLRRADNINKPKNSQEHPYPYKSFKELLFHRRAVPDFRKECYPHHLINRTIRSKFLELRCDFLNYALWIFFCPVVFLFQSMPRIFGREFVQVKCKDLV